MTAIEVQPESGRRSGSERTTTLSGTALRILGLIIFTSFSLFFIYLLLSDGYWPLAAIIGVITNFDRVLIKHGSDPDAVADVAVRFCLGGITADPRHGSGAVRAS